MFHIDLCVVALNSIYLRSVYNLFSFPPPSATLASWLLRVQKVKHRVPSVTTRHVRYSTRVKNGMSTRRGKRSFVSPKWHKRDEGRDRNTLTPATNYRGTFTTPKRPAHNEANRHSIAGAPHQYVTEEWRMNSAEFLKYPAIWQHSLTLIWGQTQNVCKTPISPEARPTLYLHNEYVHPQKSIHIGQCQVGRS